MPRGRRTNLPTAALVMEMKEKEGRSEREIAATTGLPPSTVHTILSKAAGWGEIAEGPIFKQHRAEQNKLLEVATRQLAADSFKHAADKLSEAGYYQAVVGGSILIDKARLLAGEPTEIHGISTQAVTNLDKLAALFANRLVDEQKTIDVTPTRQDGSGSQGKIGK